VREARIAEAQRARAERRFADVRKLANSLIFELHDSIQNLAGSTPARKLLVDRAAEYLDSLFKEAGNDTSLKRELAEAYRRLAIIQGDQFSASLGDPKAALASAQKAAALWTEVAGVDPSNVEDQLNMAYGDRLVGNMSANVGGDAAAHLSKAIAISEGLQKKWPDYPRVKRELSREYGSLATLLDNAGQTRAALGYLEKAYAIHSAILKSKAGDRGALRSLAVLETEICGNLARFGRWSEALRLNRESLRKFEALTADQTDAAVRREMAFVLFEQGEIRSMQGDLAAALRTYRQGYTMVAPLAAADPQNALLQGDLAGAYMAIGSTLARTGRVAKGLKLLERGGDIIRRLPARESSSSDFRSGAALHHVAMGEALARKGDLVGALRSYGESLKIFGSLASQPADRKAFLHVAAVHVQEGSVLARLGRIEPARAVYEQAISLARPFASEQGDPQAPYTLADAYSGLGNLCMLEASSRKLPGTERISRMQRAQGYYGESLENRKRIGHDAALSPDGFVCGNAREAARSLAACNAALGNLRMNNRGPAKSF
jgi:tetratricopeptide (TPR) repeat protein